jgi:hypothetical protein
MGGGRTAVPAWLSASRPSPRDGEMLLEMREICPQAGNVSLAGMRYIHSLLGALVVYTVVHALLKGQIRAGRTCVMRASEPAAYWALVAAALVIAGALFYMASADWVIDS